MDNSLSIIHGLLIKENLQRKNTQDGHKKNEKIP